MILNSITLNIALSVLTRSMTCNHVLYGRIIF